MTLQTSPQKKQLTTTGLFTSPNVLSAVPDGALLSCNNVSVDFQGLLSGRRGLRQYGNNISFTGAWGDFAWGDAPWGGEGGFSVRQIFFYKNNKIIWFGNETHPYNLAYDSSMNSSGAWTQTSEDFSAPSYSFTNRYRDVQSNGNLYLTGATGMLKLDAPQNELSAAGGFPGLDGNADLVDVAGFFPDDSQVAYRMTWTHVDDNRNDIVGTPSTRVVIANSSGGSRNVNLTFTIPVGVTTADTYKIYRSIITSPATIEPSDELQEVILGNPTTLDITNGYFTVKDSTPQAELGAALYTNSGQEGIAQSNNIPPVSRDACYYKGYVLYAAGITQQKFLISLLAVDAPEGLQNGDTITFVRGTDSFTLTGSTTAENIPLGTFFIDISGTPAENIFNTKTSLIRVLNRYSMNDFLYSFDATDVNSEASLPGDFYFQERGIGGGEFGVLSSRTTAWSPTLDPLTQLKSASGGGIGTVFCSKFKEPEAVPAINNLPIGNPNFAIERIIPLRDAVIVLKSGGDGVYKLTGETFPFTVTTLDLSVTLVAPESATLMNNQVFAYTNQGVTTITESGAGIASRPIENVLQGISSYIFPDFSKVTFGAAYETDRKWYLATVSDPSDSGPATTCYVYNTITETWTQETFPVPVWDIKENPADQTLYVCSADANYPFVFQERKSFTRLDYADIEEPTSIVSYSDDIVTVVSTQKAQVGWSLAQIDINLIGQEDAIKNISVITEVIDLHHVRVRNKLKWFTGSTYYTAYEQPIDYKALYAPIHCGTPGNIKMFQEFFGFFQLVDFDSVSFRFGTDLYQQGKAVDLIPQTTNAWGTFPWNSVPWGGGRFPPQAVRTYIPLTARRGHWLNLSIEMKQAMVGFSFGGINLVYNDVTTRMK